MSPRLPKRRLARAINKVINEMMDEGSLVQLTNGDIVYPSALPDEAPAVKSPVTVAEYEAMLRACFLAEGFSAEEYDGPVAEACREEFFDNDGMPLVAYDWAADEDGRTQYDRIHSAVEKLAAHFDPTL